MKGVSSTDLMSVIDFMYSGETSIFEDNIDSFLVVAEELKIKGLMGTFNNHQKEKQSEFMPREKLENDSTPTTVVGSKMKTEADIEHLASSGAEEGKASSLSWFSQRYDDFEKLQQKLKTFMVKSETRLPKRKQ